MAEARRLRAEVPAWKLEAQRLRRSWRLRDFAAVMRLVDQIAALAEDEGHHPDIHITEYRNLEVALWTHAVGGLSENDFILAAKIDRLAAELGFPEPGADKQVDDD